MKNYFLYLFTLSVFFSYSQTDYTAVYNYEDIIKKGIAMHDQKKYQEAITEYDKISKLDPKYFTAQYEKGLSLSGLEKKEDLKIFYKNLFDNNSMPECPLLFVSYGSLLSNEKDYAGAEKIFVEGEKYLSNNSNFLFNFAILYLRQENSQKAVDYLKRAVTIDPNRASSHYFLGLIALDNGKITEGTLALMSYLALAPTGRYATNAILKLDAKFGSNYLEKSKVKFSNSGDNFEEIETVLRNSLPLNKAYKVKSDFDDVIIRQVQAVAEYTLEHKSGNGFFETIYIPWVKTMMEQNFFEGFSYYILLDMEKKLGKKLTSNKKKIVAFSDDFIAKDFWPSYAKRKVNHFGVEQDVVIRLNDRVPYLIGNEVKGSKEGKFKILNEYGNSIAEINYKNDLLNGNQKYFDKNEQLTEEKNFTAGKLNGLRTVYYANGNVEYTENYKEDVLDGLAQTFYVNGGKNCSVNFVNGERDGSYLCTYANGTKKSESTYKLGKLNGISNEFNQVGDLIETTPYLNGEIEGDYKEFFDGKKLKSEVFYKNGLPSTNFKKYFANGTLEKENVFLNGKIKSSSEFYENGKKSEVTSYSDKEELEMYTYYDFDENKYFDDKFKDNNFKSGVQYARNNPKPIELPATKKPFVVKNFEGKELLRGGYDKGKKSGEWVYFHSNGNISSKSSFQTSLSQGKYFSYNKNGDISAIYNSVNDTIQGIYETYENNKLKVRYSYSDNNQNGPFQSFYSNGSVAIEGLLENGNTINKRFAYWQSGNITNQSNYIDGILTSQYLYDNTGKKGEFINYKNRNGLLKMVTNNGAVIQEINMINGENNGKNLGKDKFGMPTYNSNYVNGLLHGSYKSFNVDGSLRAESTYYCGKAHGENKYYDLV